MVALRLLRATPALVAAIAVAAAAGPPAAPAAAPFAALVRESAAAAGLSGDDLSPALATGGPLAEALRVRPPLAASVSNHEPAVRVHYALGPAVRDADADGVPDRAAVAIREAVRALEFCRAAGLGAPADDGDGELDIYLVPLAGAVRGYAAVERASPPGRGGAGFAVVDVSAQQDELQFRGAVSRSVARLVLAARDAGAPTWWTEPSAAWIQSRVSGTEPELDGDAQARWNQAERGIETDDPLLARGNVVLLWSIGRPAQESRAVAATWRALAARGESESALGAIEKGLRQSLGGGLADLLLRAAVVHVTDEAPDVRWALEIAELPLLDVPAALPVAPLGAALLRLAPDPGSPEGTELNLRVAEEGWTAVLVARRRDGGWDRTTLDFDRQGAAQAIVPWTDYGAAVVVLARGAATSAAARGAAPWRLSAESAGRGDLFGLSAFGVRAVVGRLVEISWSSAWEENLFGWVVERAAGKDGPWTAVNALPVPAVGLPSEGTGYLLQDEPPAGLPRVLYRLVAVTRTGLRVTGPAVTLR
ncbi:MAG: hypothetical protein KBD01_01020 [Acidobacteria bacterium]|nr:hypothetical protein [Acidobacteriota bacterium]